MFDFRVITASLAILWLCQSMSLAQKPGNFIDSRPDDSPQSSIQVAPPVAGPIVYVCDINNNLGTVALGSKTVTVLGKLGVQCTDIAFDPSGQLWGISFSTFYKINLPSATGEIPAAAAPTTSSGFNALVFDKTGRCLTEAFNSSILYDLNTKTGKLTALGNTSPFTSAGDFGFYNNQLILAANNKALVTINPTTFKTISSVPINVNKLFGLVSISKNDLIGFAGTSVYQVTPTATTTAARTKLLFNFSGHGLSQIEGAAYSGYFGP